MPLVRDGVADVRTWHCVPDSPRTVLSHPVRPDAFPGKGIQHRPGNTR